MINALDWDRLTAFILRHPDAVVLVQDDEEPGAGTPIFYNHIGMPIPIQQRYTLVASENGEVDIEDCTTTVAHAFAQWGSSYRRWPLPVLDRLDMPVPATEMVQSNIDSYLLGVSRRVRRACEWGAQIAPNTWNGNTLLDVYEKALTDELEGFWHPAAWALRECGRLVVRARLMQLQERVRQETLPELSFVYTGYAIYRFDQN